MTETGTKAPLLETALLGTAKMTDTDFAPSFMERGLTVSTVQQAKERTAETALGTDPEDVDCKPELLAKSALQPPIAALEGRVERILTDLGVVTEADVKVIIKNHLDRLPRLIKWDMVKTVEATFENALQLSYFDLL